MLFLFDYGDVDSLCQYILELTDDTKRLSIAKAGQEKAQRLFDVDSHYIELRKLLAGN